jgi:hypothetical protein
MVFSFLWSRCKKKQSYHLCRLETLARPKKYGGWGLRNIFSFYRVLTTNTLWRAFMKNGIWHRVIKDKYLPHGTVTRWLRSTLIATTQGSQTWRNLLKYLHLVLHWLAWSMRSRHSIILGKDLILGMGKYSILSEDLVVSLNQKNVHYLYQASRDLRPGTICSIWLDSEELGMVGDLATEWEKFRRALIGSGVQLLDRLDELKWTGGDNSG